MAARYLYALYTLGSVVNLNIIMWLASLINTDRNKLYHKSFLNRVEKSKKDCLYLNLVL